MYAIRSYYELTPEAVSQIGELGGTVLASSRGPQEPAEMVDYLQELGVAVLFAVGGDGTLKGAARIAEEAARRGRITSYNVCYTKLLRSVTALVLFVIANAFPFLSLKSGSIVQQTTLLSGVRGLQEQGYWLLAGVVLRNNFV